MGTFVENVNRLAEGLTEDLSVTLTSLDSRLDVIEPALATAQSDIILNESESVAALLLKEDAINKGQPNGYAPLDGSGKVPANYMSAINTIDVFTPVDEASMLALNAQNGDIAYRQDNSKAYMLIALPASTLANWKELVLVGVSSVNGLSGVVTIGTDDVGEGILNLYYTNERVDDRVAALIQAGTNMTVTYDDVANTLTVSTLAAKIDDAVASATTAYSSEKTQMLHDAQATAIANLASVSGHIANTTTPVFATIPTTATDLPFSVVTDSTDTGIFTFDDANNTITFLKDGNYNFFSTVRASSTNGTARTLSFQITNNTGGTVLITQSAVIDITSGTSESFPLNTLLTVGSGGIPAAPLTIKIKALVDAGTDKGLQSFSSILSRASVALETNVDATPTDGSANPVSSNGVFDALAGKQATLVSGTNIKTVGGTSLLGSGDIPIAGASVSGVRQTVQSASVDTSGFANFISIGTGLAVNIAATTTPIVIHAAGGKVSNDRIGTISADTSITGLTANTTNYLYADVAANGTVTLSANVVAKLEQFGGTPAVTNNLLTFNIGEMKGYTGNGATAPQTWRVCFGEAVTNATNVTSVVNYALNGIYESPFSSITAGTNTSYSHNIGTNFVDIKALLKNVTTEGGYAVGEIVDMSPTAYSTQNYGFAVSRASINSSVLSIGGAGLILIYKSTFAANAITVANWNKSIRVKRSF